MREEQYPKQEGDVLGYTNLFCLLFLAVALRIFKDTFIGQKYGVTLLLLRVKQVIY